MATEVTSRYSPVRDFAGCIIVIYVHSGGRVRCEPPRAVAMNRESVRTAQPQGGCSNPTALFDSPGG